MQVGRKARFVQRVDYKWEESSAAALGDELCSPRVPKPLWEAASRAGGAGREFGPASVVYWRWVWGKIFNFSAPHFPYPKLGLSTNLAGFLWGLMKICNQCWTPYSCFYFYWCVWRAVSTSNCPDQQDGAYFFNCFYWTNNNYIPTLCLPCAGHLSPVVIKSDKALDATQLMFQ